MNCELVIKVCGMRDAENIRSVEAVRPDWMGFILWPGSKRYVATPPAYMPAPPVKRVGVFVDPTIEDVIRQVRAFGLHLIQLHGHETPAFCLELKAALTTAGLPPLPLIKAFSVSTADDLAATLPFLRPVDGSSPSSLRPVDGSSFLCPVDGSSPSSPRPVDGGSSAVAADYFLFDTKTPLVGGSGQQFDWSILSAYDGSTPFLLSGGIGPDDAPRLKAFRHPRCIGIDLNSRFESAPAVKDTTALSLFIKQFTIRMKNEE